MNKNYVITIARQFGSGGKQAGIELSERLGIPCYDKQIVEMASEKSGLSPELFNRINEDERLRTGFFAKLRRLPFTSVAEPTSQEFTSDVNLFNIQSAIIRELADTQSCIILGKAANYVLRSYPNVVSVFIEAPEHICVASIERRMSVTEEDAAMMVEQTNRYRSEYCRFYTDGHVWKDPDGYDLIINSHRVGRSRCADLIIDYARMRLGADVVQEVPRELYT